MDLPIAFVLGLTLFALVAFVREWLPADGIALGVLGALVSRASSIRARPSARSATGRW